MILQSTDVVKFGDLTTGALRFGDLYRCVLILGDHGNCHDVPSETEFAPNCSDIQAHRCVLMFGGRRNALVLAFP